jgi:class 3 adenylate cyclase
MMEAVHRYDGTVNQVMGDGIIVFLKPLGRDDHDTAGIGEELEAKRGLHGGAVDPAGPPPVELAHRREAADARAGEPPLETAASALLVLLLAEVFEELDDAPPPFGGEGDDIIEVGGGVA